jgi:hypothetical protein
MGLRCSDSLGVSFKISEMRRFGTICICGFFCESMWKKTLKMYSKNTDPLILQLQQRVLLEMKILFMKMKIGAKCNWLYLQTFGMYICSRKYLMIIRMGLKLCCF